MRWAFSLWKLFSKLTMNGEESVLCFLKMAILCVKQIALKISVTSEMTELRRHRSWICCLLPSEKKPSLPALNLAETALVVSTASGCAWSLCNIYCSWATLPAGKSALRPLFGATIPKTLCRRQQRVQFCCNPFGTIDSNTEFWWDTNF